MSVHPPLDEIQPEHASLYAGRVRVYPKAVHGTMRRIKWAVLIVCLSVYYLLPWLRWSRGEDYPDQAVLLDIANRKFYFFWLELWPQDIYLLTGLLVMAAVGLFLVTSLAGRVWCGYTCPQTVWTDLFMLVERWLQGDRNERMKRDRGPMNFDKAWRKAATHAIWLGIAFWTGGAWIMYYADAPTVTAEFWTGRASMAVYGFTFLFTATTYLLAGWAREQVCTYMCPWPRFQSAMLDEQSFTTTYQAWRGEPRSRHIKREADAAAHGDCIDCGACVAACPTGIDIRDGVQLECINCGLCIDACNSIMDRIERPRGLIAWDTLARQTAKARGVHEKVRFLRARSVVYLVVLLMGLTAIGTALALRPIVEVAVLHDRAPLFVRLSDGRVRNGYTIKISNKTRRPAAFALTATGVPDAVLTAPDIDALAAGEMILSVPPDSTGAFRILLAAPPVGLHDGSKPVEFHLRDTGSGQQATRATVFLGPNQP